MRFDSSAVLRVADQMGAAAELLDRAVADHLARLAFGGAVAGRAHSARGEALRVQLERLTAEVTRWSRAAAETAAALRTGAETYADAELYATARIA
jgi:hypothetical protein